jgi:H+/gluconate symporter-like permease
VITVLGLLGILIGLGLLISSIANFMTRRLGPQRAVLAAGIPWRLMPAAIVLGTSTFTMSALPGAPSIQIATPLPFFGTTAFVAQHGHP